jgi:sugar O-acyltransferase, sialic acid O-acetyltransferase NeuD family
MRSSITIIGSGGHAHSALDVIESTQHYDTIQFVDSQNENEQVYGLPLVDLESAAQLDTEFVVAIGDNFQRQRVSKQLLAQYPHIKYATLIHAKASVSARAKIGQGSVVMAGAIVNAGTELGKGALINSQACVEHDCKLGDFASLAPAAVLGGKVSIGERSSIGLGARIKHGVRIVEDICVGANSLVLKDCLQAKVVVYGSPAKQVRARQPDEAYL